MENFSGIKKMLSVMMIFFIVGCSVIHKKKRITTDNRNVDKLVCYFFKDYVEREFGAFECDTKNVQGEIFTMTIKIDDYENNHKECYNSMYYFDDQKRITSKYIFNDLTNQWQLIANVFYSDSSLFIKYFTSDVVASCLFNKEKSEILILRSDSLTIDSTVVLVDFSKNLVITNAYGSLKPFEGDSSVDWYSHFNQFGYIDTEGVVKRGKGSILNFTPTVQFKYSKKGVLIGQQELESFKEEYKFDEKGNVVLTKDMNGRFLKSVYEFDENKNYTKNITFLINGSQLDTAYVINRKFEYIK